LIALLSRFQAIWRTRTGSACTISGSGREVDVELHALLLRVARDRADGVAHDERQRHQVLLHRELAGHHARHVEEVVDEARLRRGRLVDDLGGVPAAGP
jgi:hypothetical protein